MALVMARMVVTRRVARRRPDVAGRPPRRNHAIAGSSLTDVLFMAALLGVGVALILGIGMRLAAGAGALLTVMMWTAVLPPASNPFMDEHLVYAAVLIVLALLGAGNTLGLGRIWAALPLVRRASWLR